jgi:phenylalanyl-tRNA synthetase alpha chain
MIDELKKEIEKVKKGFLQEIDRILSKEDLKKLRDKYTSRKNGILTELMHNLKKVSKELRPIAGQTINELKLVIENKFKETEKTLTSKVYERVDYSLPEFDLSVGYSHILSDILTKIEDIFLNSGYEIAYGFEVESEYNNFTALNIPEHHPARDEHDTFFIKDFENTILRTHTSPVQIRYMDINFSHLKGTLESFIKSFFGENINVRFRPGYFPFTEPSAEVDISCFLCFGKDQDCKICKGTGWLEILGSGMVHPKVLLNCNINPEEYSGFAFGMGVERIALLKYGIPDIRMFYENDIRFLSQFG